MKRLSTPKSTLGLGVLIFAVMGLVLWAPLIYDDVALISGNPDVTGPWLGFRHFFMQSYAPEEAYEPLIAAIHRLLFFFVGSTPFWYRLTSLLMHWGNCALVLLIFSELIEPAGAALALAAVFAVYPAHTEVLALSTFKKHLVVAMCALLMIYLEKPWRDNKASLLRRVASFACLTAALMTKEHGLMLPPILLSWSLALAPDWKARLRRDALFYAGLFIAGLFFLWFRFLVIPRGITPLIGESVSVHILTSAKILLWYLRELALPWQLCQEHWLQPVYHVISWETAAIASALAVLAAAVAAVWKRDRIAFCGLALTLLWLTPYLNLVPYLNISLVANRYLYLAFAGVLLCVGRLCAPVWRIKVKGLSAGALACAGVGLCYAALSTRNLARYSDSVDLWARAAECAPEHARAHVNLAWSLVQRRRSEEAEREYRTACRLGRGIAVVARTQLAMTIAQRGDCRRAALMAEAILRDGKHYGSDWKTAYLLGACQLKNGDYKKAFKALTFALELNPYDLGSRLNLGRYYDHVGDYKRAEIAWTAAKGGPETRILALNALAGLYLKRGRREEARKAYEDSLAEQPLQLDAVRGLASLYAQAGRPEKGRALYDTLVDSLTSHEANRLSVQDEMSPSEDSLALQNLSAVHRARADFYSRYPPS